MNLLIEYQYFGNFISYKNLYNITNIIFDEYENYKKSSLRNRMSLVGANGLLQLSIPILGGREQKQPMGLVKIDYREKWQTKHMKSICSMYGSSPWFEYYYDELKNLYKQEVILLKNWNLLTFEWACKKLKINANVADFDSLDFLSNETNIIDARDWKIKNTNNGTYKPLPYRQVFQEKVGFQPEVSILDLILCEGPNAKQFLV